MIFFKQKSGQGDGTRGGGLPTVRGLPAPNYDETDIDDFVADLGAPHDGHIDTHDGTSISR